MRRFEATCWIPRETDVGPVEIVTGSGTCEVTLASEQMTLAGNPLVGARATVAMAEGDDTLPDDHVFAKVRDVAMVAINRLVQVARLLSTRPKAIVPVLHESEFHGLVVVEVTISGSRTLAAMPVGPRSIRVAKPLTTAEVKPLLAPLANPGSADTLWRAALEAACSGRSADAVVGARAALEAAWVATVEAAVAEHKRTAPAPLVVFFDAYLAEATKGSTGVRERLDRYSKALLGDSFRDRWGDPLWGQVLWTFEIRNLVAHGKGAVTLDDAFRVVGYLRRALDDIAAQRARFP